MNTHGGTVVTFAEYIPLLQDAVEWAVKDYLALNFPDIFKQYLKTWRIGSGCKAVAEAEWMEAERAKMLSFKQELMDWALECDRSALVTLAFRMVERDDRLGAAAVAKAAQERQALQAEVHPRGKRDAKKNQVVGGAKSPYQARCSKTSRARPARDGGRELAFATGGQTLAGAAPGPHANPGRLGLTLARAALGWVR